MSLKTVALHTLGCKLNYSETSSISRLLHNEGFEEKKSVEVADLYVINTCSVTENADKECRQLVRKFKKLAPASTIVVTGCYAQLKSAEISAIEGVDIVLGAAEKFNIVTHLNSLANGNKTKVHSCEIDDVNDFKSSYSLNARTRTFLKVQDGCDYNCSFCTIPMARGKSRSNSISQVLNDVHTILNNGVQEIVLTGINLGDYGKMAANLEELPDKVNLLSLLVELEKTGVKRFRISSIEPNLLTTDIINFVAASKNFMPHFHIPLQSGSNKILGLMRRRYKKETYREKVDAIKNIMPHCSIGVDVITGFPGETEEDFLMTYHFLDDLDISYLHVFTYSERENTHAFNMSSPVPLNIRHSRTKKLRELSFLKQQAFTAKHKGQSRKVLFEGKDKNNLMEGYTDNYIKIAIPHATAFENNIVDWVI